MSSADASNDTRILRVVLVGKAGSGKSATGNTIIGTRVFEEDNSPSSVTQRCQRALCYVGDRRVAVIDTPGVFDTTLSEESLTREMEVCMAASVPGPHVFLLVLRVGVRFTEEEKKVFGWLSENFGADARQYTLAVFTHADELRGSVESYISRNADLREVVNQCRAGYVALDNTQRLDRTQVADLLEKIEQIVQRNGGPYSSAKFEEVQKKMKSDAWWAYVGRYRNEIISTTMAATALTCILKNVFK